MTSDEKIFDIAVAGIRRASMDPNTWAYTSIGGLHRSFSGEFAANAGELVIASGYRSTSSWYVFTTRRIVACRHGEVVAINPTQGITTGFGNFKGAPGTKIGAGSTFEIARISEPDSGHSIEFEYETGKPSMAAIYAARYWQRPDKNHRSSIG